MPLAVDHVHHFDLGNWLAFFAYATSAVGCVVGLAATQQARSARSMAARIGWLLTAAVAIGGVGIWLMHFIAMLGFTTPGLPVRYDIGRTGISALLAVGAVFTGLLVFSLRPRFSLWRLLLAGLITGLAVALMHYAGMWALNIKGEISYDTGLFALSIAIAVAAATAALWFTVATDRLGPRVIAGLIMGVAVTGMHYTGMAAVRVSLDPGAPDPAGVEVFTFLLPIFVGSAVVLAAMISAVFMANAPEPVEESPAEPVRSRGEPVGPVS
jgi:NO-binding membrane sensor protein with MHYT domain